MQHNELIKNGFGSYYRKEKHKKKLENIIIRSISLLITLYFLYGVHELVVRYQELTWWK